MEKVYLWFVHDDRAHEVQLTEAEVLEIDIPIQYMDLNKHYQLFVVSREDRTNFLQKTKDVFPCQFKVYEFSDDGLLVGEHYVDPLIKKMCSYPGYQANQQFHSRAKGSPIFSLPILTLLLS